MPAQYLLRHRLEAKEQLHEVSHSPSGLLLLPASTTGSSGDSSSRGRDKGCLIGAKAPFYGTYQHSHHPLFTLLYLVPPLPLVADCAEVRGGGEARE